MLCFPALLSLILGCRSRSQFELFQESHLTLDLDLGRSLQLIRDDTLSRDHRNSSKNENRQSKDCHLKQNIHKIWVFWLLLGFMYFCSWLAENHKSYMFMPILMYIFSPCQVVPGVCLSQKVPQCATSNTPKRHPFFTKMANLTKSIPNSSAEACDKFHPNYENTDMEGNWQTQIPHVVEFGFASCTLLKLSYHNSFNCINFLIWEILSHMSM